MIEQTITVGNIIEIAVILVSVTAFAVTMKGTVRSMKDDIVEMKDDIKTINKIVTDNAVINKRLDHLEDSVNEMKHGQGFVQARRGFEGEYP